MQEPIYFEFLREPTIIMPFKSPIEVVQAQLDAYNAKDIDALLGAYAPDAEQYQLHGGLLARGSEEMRRKRPARPSVI
jgi:hypothetical protein